MVSERHIRIFVNQKLNPGEKVELSDKLSHYLCNVMRCRSGEHIKSFNAVDGEFFCTIVVADKKKTVVTVETLCRPAEKESDIWLLFAPLKKDKTDFVVEKAVELGVSRIIPVLTRYTNSSVIKIERWKAQSVEAAEQCGRLSIPDIGFPQTLEKQIENWPKERILFFMDERRQGESIVDAFRQAIRKPAAILIGPEGGFSDEEAAWLNKQSFVKNINLGPRILRAETAATAALSVWQAVAGDWIQTTE